MVKNLVVFDFDWSFVDQDTDRWVFEVLDTKLRRKLQDRKSAGSQCMPDVVSAGNALSERGRRRRQEREHLGTTHPLPLTARPVSQRADHSDETMQDLFNAGYKKDQVLDALRQLPVHPAMKRAVTNLKNRGETTFLCLSNSNEVYIGTILEKHGLTDLFDQVITNPAKWVGDRLHIGRRLPADGPQHGCTVGCLPNMCKGDELDAWLEAHGGKDSFDKIVYVGDGGNDFCPLLRMREGDLGLVRKNYELEKRIEREGKEKGCKIDVTLWDQAWIVDEVFSKL
ncbi:hypothetical protein A1Q1_02576 [Trichosporon asahii var. asahii CBS 2479]|uniref:Pyridoxal phosphate phosphatase phospho2 n=1 Tax=Trichosporon asahii var. asahii (strain ATCC 90039 / CBS 2479 / JCM 2466 / KCTC 7840 / NBRC 103889/ NCYC 2677 / UAMH 7654) TaxID=1186058 RepID=J6EV22_TRIAS|nr:hypothetical protein A1Q1_02576 [Trichosporon asahii var. asahii CBS 2479]EJT48444.1 hypothetical protein A1Q1_02576 [Trichosporon asahii var. asahii CBS 2479]